MLLDAYEDIKIYRNVNGWEIGRAVATRENSAVGINRFALDTSIPTDVLHEYLSILQNLYDHPYPHLVSVLAFEATKDQLVVVSEWFGTEDLLTRKDQGMSFNEIWSVSVEISRAIQHLHAHGIVHRTIAPEHVLFEPSTAKVYLNVPLWNFTKSSNSVDKDHVFTAPEVLSARQFSAASDIYALGIILYSVLVGRFPWIDQHGFPRERIEEDSVPRLPPPLSAVQEHIDDMLAFDPSARKLPDTNVINLDSDGTDESQFDHDIRYRSGKIDPIEIQSVTSPLDLVTANTVETASGRSRFWLYSTLSAIALVGLLSFWYSYTNFDSVKMVLYEIGIAEHPELSERWRQAESLRLDQNQSLITLIAAYNKVLEIRPNHSGAIRSIATEKEKRREKIDALIKSDDFTIAQARLDEYVAAVPNDPEIVPLVTELENRQRRDRLLADAQTWVASGIEDLVLLDTAVRAYQTVLSVFPDSEEARRQLNNIAVMYVEEAIDSANESDIDRAWHFFEKAQEADPDVQALEDVRGIVELAESLETEINTTIQRATTFFADGHLITPPGEDNAMSTFRQVLVLDPNNELAQAKLQEIEKQIVVMHGALLQDREFGAEVNLVRAAEQAGISENTLQSMRQALENLQRRIADAAELYRKAMSLFQRGYISGPADDNAIDVLRDAQSLDTKNTEVQELLNQCAERTATVAQEAFNAGLIDRAKGYLSIALSIQPMNDNWSNLYQQWSQFE